MSRVLPGECRNSGTAAGVLRINLLPKSYFCPCSSSKCDFHLQFVKEYATIGSVPSVYLKGVTVSWISLPVVLCLRRPFMPFAGFDE